MLIVSMYTANLTAFMTLDKQGVTLSSATDLLYQQDDDAFSWGINPEYFSAGLLRSHTNHEYRRLAENATPVENIRAGIEKVGEGNFVYIDDTRWLQHHTTGMCDVFFVGEELASVTYAFGIPNNSPYARLLNRQILQYRESGYFIELWDKLGAHPICETETVGNNDKLSFMTLQGIFYVLGWGLLVSLMLLVVEVGVATARDQYPGQPNMTFWGKLRKRIQLKRDDVWTEWLSSCRGRGEDGLCSVTVRGNGFKHLPDLPVKK